MLSAKDYYDMAAMLRGYPSVHVTFNLTPVLMRQLDDIAAGAGDQYRVLAVLGATPQKQSLEPKIIVDPAARTVTLRVPREALGAFDPAKAGYVAAVLSQDDHPVAGVWRVRDVEQQASQWRAGGAPADTNHTRIIDVAWPADARPTQAESLSGYPASREPNMDKLAPGDFARVPLLTAGP